MKNRSQFRILLVLAAAICTRAASAQVVVTNQDGTVEIVQPGPPPEPSAGSLAQTAVAAVQAGIQPPALPGPLVPGAEATIEGINYDDDASTTGYYNIPPDPCGAVGSNQVVSIVNTTIEWHTKTGTRQMRERLGKNGSTASGSFFESLSPVNSLFDPKVIYDQHEGRFLVVALERQDTARGDSANTSRILLAVSDDDDPNGTWYFMAMDSKTKITGTDTWADYPGFAVDEEAVYITANVFPFGSSSSSLGTRLWIVNKTPFYSNGTPTFTVHDPYGSAGLGNGGTLQPAHIFGTGGVGSGAGTFLVGAGWTSGSDDELLVIRVDSPLSSPTFTDQFIILGNIHDNAAAFPDAPQAGTSNKIATNDGRPQQAVWRDNNLYAVNTVVPPSGTDAGQTTAHWYRIDTTNLATLTLLDQGDIGGEDIATGTYTFFPSIAVDALGNMAVGFAASAATFYPGAYYTGRLATDTAGTTQTAVAVAAGVDYYYRAFGGSENRWGDYSGTALDPSDEKEFWIFNEYALTRGSILSSYPTEDGRWGTRWASFKFNNNPVPVEDPITRAGTQGVKVSKTTLLANDTDPDGDTLTISSVSSTSANGGTVSVSGNWIFYTPPSGSTDPDSFTYTVSDGQGGTQTGTVGITLPEDNSQAQNSKIVDEGSTVRVIFRGIPGRTYRIQYATSLPTTTWTTLDTRTADTAGAFEYIDNKTDPARYYRSVYP